jgi:hypothetical protein
MTTEKKVSRWTLTNNCQLSASAQLRNTDTKEKSMANQSTISEFWEFLKFRKRYWLLPIVLVLFLLGALIVFSESSAVAPFIYMLF